MPFRPVALPPLVVAATLVFTASPAHADDDLQRARALFDEAGDLERIGEWSLAQERLRAALRLHETPHLHYALGWALENDEKPAAARAEYETARNLAERTGAEEVRALATLRMAALDRRAQARLTGESRHDAAGADGGDSKSRGRALPLLLVATGGVAVISGVVLLVSSANDAATRNQASRTWCDATSCVDGIATRPETDETTALRREAYDAAARGNAKQITGAVLGAVGLVGVAVGTYLLLDEPKPSQASKTGRVGVEASPLPGGAFGAATIAF